MKHHRTQVGAVAIGWLLCTSCSATGADDTERGQLFVQLEAGLQQDVESVSFEIVAAGAECGSTPIASRTVALEAEALPGSLSPESGPGHAFSDALFVLPAGDYEVCATPMNGAGPSPECGLAEESVSVIPGQTTEVVLISQCNGDASGGLDVVLALNAPPEISALELAPSKFINACELLTLTVTANDPDDAALDYAWEIASGPEGAALGGEGASVTFSGPVGDYEVTVAVTDPHGAEASLVFPVHVTECAVPLVVQEIFEAKCSGCHTASSAGGLSLASAAISYTSLVDASVRAASCSDRTLVVPGDAASSYLVEKLLGSAGICGSPMPRGRDPLPAEEIATIEAWIDSL